MTTHDSKRAIIATSLHRARLRRAIRYLEIDETVILADGAITRLSNRQARYDMRGVSVKLTAMWDKLVDYLLVTLELETVAAQAENHERIAEEEAA